jgi:hypothetical protein
MQGTSNTSQEIVEAESRVRKKNRFISNEERLFICQELLKKSKNRKLPKRATNEAASSNLVPLIGGQQAAPLIFFITFHTKKSLKK